MTCPCCHFRLDDHDEMLACHWSPGAQVLTIKTKEENDFVREYMEKNPLITSRTWLGLDLDTEGTHSDL